MATKVQIIFDYGKALAVSAYINDTAGDIEKKVQEKLSNTNIELKNSWQGENANEFLKKAETIEGKLGQCVTDLYSIADTVAQIAKNIYDAEMASLEVLESESSS